MKQSKISWQQKLKNEKQELLKEIHELVFNPDGFKSALIKSRYKINREFENEVWRGKTTHDKDKFRAC